MFAHIFKYRLLKITKSKSELLLSFVFPLVLATCFYIAFGNMTAKDESFHSIPVAIVMEKEDASMKEALEEASTGASDDGSIIDITYLNKQDATNALTCGEVDGIIYVNDHLSLEITENGVNQSLLKIFLDRFTQTYYTLSTVAAFDPSKIELVRNGLGATPAYNQTIPLTDGNMDPFVQHFFALIAMACLYGAFNGLTCSSEVKADLSALAARRAIAPVKRSVLIAADFSATALTQFINVFILIIYIRFILNINFGNQFGYITLTALIGSIIGVAFGFFIGSLPKITLGVRQGLCIGTIMTSCFLGDLMFRNIRIAIEHSCPIVNRLNPAALLADAFYSLNIYTDHQRYFMNLAILLVFAFVLCTASFLMTRRERYASL